MRFLSGIQPTGALHLGNYFGMMRPAIELQEEGEAFYFIADFHALTTVRDRALLSRNIHEVAIDFLACGLKPEKACFFRQSDVPAVTELAWILSTIAPMGLLERCHSYKDKTARGLPATHGLFSYPILMAADILAYDSDSVPVGRDQKQHLEVTRDLAVKFNEAFGPTFKLPEARIQEVSAVVPGLNGEKMSKSYNNTIGIFEERKALEKKIMGIPTDSTPISEPKPTEGSVILGLYRLVASDDEFERMVDEYRSGGVGYGNFKKRLVEKIWDYFGSMREARQAIASDTDYVEDVLRKGAERASRVAEEVMERVRGAVGLRWA